MQLKLPGYKQPGSARVRIHTCRSTQKLHVLRISSPCVRSHAVGMYKAQRRGSSTCALAVCSGTCAHAAVPMHLCPCGVQSLLLQQVSPSPWRTPSASCVRLHPTMNQIEGVNKAAWTCLRARERIYVSASHMACMCLRMCPRLAYCTSMCPCHTWWAAGWVDSSSDSSNRSWCVWSWNTKYPM